MDDYPKDGFDEGMQPWNLPGQFHGKAQTRGSTSCNSSPDRIPQSERHCRKSPLVFVSMILRRAARICGIWKNQFWITESSLFATTREMDQTERDQSSLGPFSINTESSRTSIACLPYYHFLAVGEVQLNQDNPYQQIPKNNYRERKKTELRGIVWLEFGSHSAAQVAACSPVGYGTSKAGGGVKQFLKIPLPLPERDRADRKNSPHWSANGFFIPILLSQRYALFTEKCMVKYENESKATIDSV